MAGQPVLTWSEIQGWLMFVALLYRQGTLTKRHHPEISGNPIEWCLNWLKICMIDIFRILVWFRVNPMRSICPKNHHIWGIKSDEKSHTFGLPGHAGACCRGLDLNLLLSPGLPLPWSCPSLPWFAYPRRRSVTAVGKIRWSSWDCEISREAVSFWGRPSITRIDGRSIYGLVNWGFWTNGTTL